VDHIIDRTVHLFDKTAQFFQLLPDAEIVWGHHQVEIERNSLHAAQRLPELVREQPDRFGGL
jgi:hypothetical protein